MKKPTVAFVALALILVGLAFVLPSLDGSQNNEYFIFHTLAECEKLIPADQTNVTIKRYEEALCDEDAKDLSYHDFFGVKFQSDTLEYEIFAYEFDDAETALTYCIRASGRDNYKASPDAAESKFLSASRGLFSYQIVIAFQNRAYHLTAPRSCYDEINALLSSCFSQKLP